MNKFYFVLLLLIILSCRMDQGKIPNAEKGVLDLTTWDTDEDKLIILAGEWEVFWEKLLTGRESYIDQLNPTGYLNLPASWIGKRLDNVQRLDRYGYATFRIKILMGCNNNRIKPGLYIPYAGCSYKIFYKNLLTKDTMLIAEGGIVGKSLKSEKPLFTPSIIEIDSANDFELYIQVSNYHDSSNAGLYKSILFGTNKGIKSFKRNLRDLNFFLIGIYFFAFIFNILIYLLRRTERSPLWLSGICLMIGLRILIMGHYIEEVFPKLYIFSVYMKLEMLPFYIASILFIMFINDFFKKIYPKNFVLIALIFSLISIFLALISPEYFILYDIIFKLFILFCLISILMTFYLIIKLTLRKYNIINIITLIGIIILFITVINDLLSVINIIHTSIMVPIGLFIFISINTCIIAISNAKARKIAEFLSNNLSIEVEKRTRELNISKRNLEYINKKLEEAMNALWGEMEIAKKLQSLLLPKNPAIKGYEITTFIKPAEDVGGDYYDFIKSNDINWITIGDVSGHGVLAGLIMMMVQTSIRTTISQNPQLKPFEIIERVNNIIFENIKMLDEDKYMALLILKLEKNGVFYYSGNLQDIMIYRHEKNIVETFQTTGIWVGILENLHGLLNEHKIKLDKGDTLMIFTDGLVEAWEKTKTKEQNKIVMFEFDRLKNIFQKNGGKSTEDIKNAVLKELKNYFCHDDIAMIIMRRES